MLEVTKKRAVKTRKKHDCYGCLEVIEKGEPAVHVCGKEDGHFRSLHLHIHCHIAAMKNDLFTHDFTKGAVKRLQQNEEYGTTLKTTYPFD